MNDTRTRMINVTSKSYGTDYFDPRTNKMMVHNMILIYTLLDGNCRAEESLYTVVDNQEKVKFNLYESDVAELDIEESEAQLIGKLSVKLPQPNCRGTEVKLVLEVDTEGILSVYVEVGDEVFDCNLKLSGIKSSIN